MGKTGHNDMECAMLSSESSFHERVDRSRLSLWHMGGHLA